jgi:hypothetical protein
MIKPIFYGEKRNYISAKHFIQSFAAASHSGVPIMTAIEASGRDFPVYRKEAEILNERIRQGKGFTESIAYIIEDSFAQTKPTNLSIYPLCVDFQKFGDYIGLKQNLGELNDALLSGYDALAKLVLKTKYNLDTEIENKPSSEIKKNLIESYKNSHIAKAYSRIADIFRNSPELHESELSEIVEVRLQDFVSKRVIPDFWIFTRNFKE